MKYFVYIIYSEIFDKSYIGQTNDLTIRIQRHNDGSEKFTKPYRPWVLRFYIEKDSRAEAMQLEKKLKNLSKERLNEFILKYSSLKN